MRHPLSTHRNNVLKLHARPYRDATDLVGMRQLLVFGAQARIAASYMHPGSLDWDTHFPPEEAENRRNLLLWERWEDKEDSPVLEAWAMLWRHEGTFDLFVSPALYGTSLHETVMEEYMVWAEARARAAGLSHIAPFWVRDSDAVMIRLMESHGFTAVSADPSPPLFERTLDDLPMASLPDGFTVQGVHTPDDGRQRAAVTYAAFRSHSAWEDYCADYARFRESAVYDAERDLLVLSPEGRGASACCLWFDAVNTVGLFEPVATHPDFQGQGLGKAVMLEGMRRMKAAGMRRAILGFDPNNRAALALYTSLGFRASGYFAMYQKEL